mgnify:CR=1 FL=1
MGKNGEIVLTAEDGSEEAFFVVEKAEIAGRVYLLVSDQEWNDEDDTTVENQRQDEGTALILRVKEEGDGSYMMVCDVVEDEKELTIVSKYFEELMEGIDISV